MQSTFGNVALTRHTEIRSKNNSEVCYNNDSELEF